MRLVLPALLCAAVFCVSTVVHAEPESAPAAAEQVKTPVSPSAALVDDLAQEVLETVGNVSECGVAVSVLASDTRLERALQEAVMTALFEKGIPVLEAPKEGAPTVRLVAFATPAALPEGDKPNLLSKGFSVVRNVLVSDPRVSLVTKPFARDGKRAPDATILVTMSVARQGKITARRTNAYSLPGAEPLAQLALTHP